jgi:hypothetical protein
MKLIIEVKEMTAEKTRSYPVDYDGKFASSTFTDRAEYGNYTSSETKVIITPESSTIEKTTVVKQNSNEI